MVKNIVLKHEKIFDYLIKLHQRDKSFIFVPRKINNQNRLKEGHWFIGNDKYLQVSLWDGTDWKEKVHNIGFLVTAEGNSYIEISSQDSVEKAKFLRLLAEKLGGFTRVGKKNKWERKYSGKDYLSNLKIFLRDVKPVVDGLIRKYKPDSISFPDENFYKKYVNPVIALRKKRKKFGETNKVVRICWNTEGWKFPSGPQGKSADPNSYEAKYGYGHEEWLFDRSRIIDGYHYAFLEPLNVESGKHIGNTYKVSLFTINGDNRKFYVGDINKVICISNEEAKAAYQVYKERGWFKELVNDIHRVKADSDAFLKNFSEFIFNVKFKFEDVHVLDELEEISDEDLNITTNRFKLLPKKTDFSIKKGSVDEDESEGNFRSETPRKRKIVFKKEVEYDPYHNRMQNALKKLLKDSYKKDYDKVCIEKGRVDIKAKTHNGAWHYFEIKTDTPKICIRNALGQIMEYVYWPDSERAEKLIIVGDTVPSDEAKKYLRYIRNKFNIHVYYRSFDIGKMELSEDY